MNLLQQILNTSIPTESPDLYEQNYMRKKLVNEDLKTQMLNDPTYADKILAHFSRSAMTEKASAKMPVGVSLEKAMSVIDKNDPRRAMYAATSADMSNIIRSTPFGGDPRQVIADTIKSRMESIKPSTYKYIQDNSGLFGKDVAPEAGYDEWNKKNPGWSNPIANAAIGAGGELLSMPLLSKVAQASKLATPLRMIGSVLSMAPPIGGGILAKLIGAGLMGVTAFGAMDAVKKASASAGHEMSIPEELLAGIPIFGGLNAIGKAGGKVFAEGAENLAKNLSFDGAFSKSGRGVQEFFGGEGNRIPQEFNRLASPGSQFTMENGNLIESAIPGKLVPKPDTTKEDLLALNNLKEMNKAEKLVQSARMEEFGKLTTEDLEAIQLGADPTKVKADRIQLNSDAYESGIKASKDKLNNDIIESARSIREMDSSIDGETSIEMARRKLSPTQVETSDDFSFLRKNTNIPEAVINTMNPVQAATNRMAWETHGMKSTAENPFNLPTTIDKPDSGLPVAVPVKPNVTPFTVKKSNQINVGAPDRTLITGPDQPTIYLEYDTEALDKRLTEAAALRASTNNDATIERLKQAAIERSSNVTSAIIKEVAPVTKSITKTVTGKSFIEAQANLVSDTEQVGKAILDSSATKDEKIINLQKLAQISTAKAEALVNEHNLDGGDKAQVLRASLSKINHSLMDFLPAPVDEMEKVAQKEMHSLVEPVMPVTSPLTIQRTEKETTRLLKQKAAEWKKLNVPYKGELTEEYLDKHDAEISAFFNKWKKVGLMAITGTALVPIASMLSPDEAQASPLTNTAITSTAAKLIKESGNPIIDMVKRLVENGHGAPVLADDGQGIKSFMRGQSYAPSDVSIFPKTKVMTIMDKLFSPHTRGEVHFDARGNGGERLPYNPAVEMGDRSQVINANTEASLTAVKNILDTNNITGDLNEIAALTEPLSKKYHETMNLQIPYYNARVQMLDDILSGNYRSAADSKSTELSKMIKLANKDVSKLDPEDKAFYDVLINEKQKVTDALTNLEPIKQEFFKEHDALMKDLASKYSTSRVALATDGVGMSGEDPWLINMLSDNERKAVTKLSDLNTSFGVRMQETGHDIIAGPYMHHPAHPSVDYATDLKSLEKFSSDGANAMRLVNFFHRTADSKLMIPDTAYIMGKYIPDATKRIEISDFWKMSEKGGWDFVKKQMEARGGYDGAIKMLDDLRTAFDPADTYPASKWLNRYAALEVARLLTLSPSVSFKHILKTMGNWSVFSSEISISATGHNVDLMAKQLAQVTAGSTFTGKDVIADLSRAYTNQSHVYAAVSDMAPYELPTNTLDKWLSNWNKYGSTAVNGVEHWDRGQTFASSMLMASRKGMTPEQARYSLMDSVLKVNFLTGPNNPKWLKDPFIRTMLMFQGTPFKILEQRAMLAYQAGKDVKNMLGMLNDLRGQVKQGEANFKWNMLKDELTKSKDIYGTPYSQQFLRQMVTMGAVIGTGKMAFDSDLWGHVVHIPGVKLNEKAMELGVNPIVSSAYQTTTGANKTAANEDEFWMSRFFNTWLGSSGVNATLRKAMKLSNNDIPTIYQDNKLNYLFGVPKSKEE